MAERTFASALVLFAHPDDAEFMCGGTVARWARDGCDVHYVVITDGSAGSNEPGVTREELRPVREREQRAAAAVLGVQSVTFLGEVDGMLEVTLDTRRKVCREVRRLRPEVLVAPDPSRLWFGSGYINHWDHKQAGLLALTAVMPDAPVAADVPRAPGRGAGAVRGAEPLARHERGRTRTWTSRRPWTRSSRRSPSTSPSTPREQRASSGNEPKRWGAERVRLHLRRGVQGLPPA